MPPDLVCAALQYSIQSKQISPMLLSVQGAHWLITETIGTDIALLLKQNIFDIEVLSTI